MAVALFRSFWDWPGDCGRKGDDSGEAKRGGMAGVLVLSVIAFLSGN